MRIGSWARETTATTGTGTATLSGAVTGRTAFGDALSDGQVFPYVIEDGNNRESGVGTYTVSGTTVARSIVLETLVSGTYDNTTPTAITLSGSAEFYIGEFPSQRIETFTNIVPLNTTNDTIRSAGLEAGLTTQTLAANRVYCSEFVLYGSVELTKLGFEVDTISTSGSEGRMGIYRHNGTNLTWELIAQTDEFATSTAAKVETSFVSAATVFLDPGFYLLALGTDTDVTTKSYSNSQPVFLLDKDTDSTSRTRGLQIIGGYNTTTGLATSPTFSSAITSNVPTMWGVSV